MAKIINSKFFIFLLILSSITISTQKKNKKEKQSIRDEYDSRHRHSQEEIDDEIRRRSELDQRSCQNKIRKLIHKYDLNKGPTIDKGDYKGVFTRAFRMCFDELIDHSKLIDLADFDNSSFDSLVEAIYYKLMEKYEDDISMEEAIGMFEPHTLLDAASEVFKGFGHPNLVKEQIDKVMGTDKDNNKNNDNKEEKRRRRRRDGEDIVYDL